MTGRIVFLLEEPSMKNLIDGLLPRLFPGLAFQCLTHEGKTDLDRSIPRKLRGWREPGVRFIVVRDNDDADCRQVKRRIVDACAAAGRPDTLVRLVCQELESWYLGDLQAFACAYPDANMPALQRRYRNPDSVKKPSVLVRRLAPAFQKLDGARRMAQFLSCESNLSHSFRVFLAGIERMAAEMGYSRQETRQGDRDLSGVKR